MYSQVGLTGNIMTSFVVGPSPYLNARPNDSKTFSLPHRPNPSIVSSSSFSKTFSHSDPTLNTGQDYVIANVSQARSHGT